jgi:glycosyltransferase involved in cell wall biosynthesis
MRVLILSHGHPTFSKGGAELAAYYLYQGINESDENEAWLVARAEQKLLHLGTPISSLNDREYLIAGNADVIDLSTCQAVSGGEFADLLGTINPDVIHFHHYAYLGLELIRAVKQACPDSNIILTLHEYIAICMNNGQMVKTDGRLCYQYSPRECAQCFPERTSESFFLRERYIKSFFSLVDAFISPSKFLRDRYVAWGLPAEKLYVIENGLPVGSRITARKLREGDRRGRFAYFGQINPFKGLDVVIEAFERLPKSIKKQVSLDIFGSGLEWQSAEYKSRFASLLDNNKALIRYHGPYEPQEMGRLMRDVDWVVMGSIWWENSPLVIQEAYKFGRPVICPDIGGMAEKVHDGLTGLHYRARDPVSLSAVIESVISDNDCYDALCSQLPNAPTVQDCVASHLDLYGRLGHVKT